MAELTFMILLHEVPFPRPKLVYINANMPCCFFFFHFNLADGLEDCLVSYILIHILCYCLECSDKLMLIRSDKVAEAEREYNEACLFIIWHPLMRNYISSDRSTTSL